MVVPPPPRRSAHGLESLDGFRAVAALMVLTTHVAFHTGAILWPGTGPVLARLDFGVPLFFIISGFLLFRPWVIAALAGDHGPDLRVYLRRRWARIFPAYWLMLAAAILVFPENREAGISVWAQYALLVQVYTDPNALVGLTHIWSLSVEVTFYLALPLLGGLLVRRRATPRALLWSVIALGAVGWGFRLLVIGPLEETTAGYWFPSYLDWFALGMVAAIAHSALHLGTGDRWVLRLKDMAGEWATSLGIGVLLFIISCTPVAGPLVFVPSTAWESTIKHVLYGLAAFFLLLPVLLGEGRNPVARTMSSGVPMALGRISYGIFLWHLMLLELIAPAIGLTLFGGGFFRLWVLTVAATLPVAWLSWVLVEQPLQRWSHRRVGDTASASALSAARPAASTTHDGAD